MIEVKKHFTVTLELDESDAHDLWVSIYEAMGSVPDNNWRSDPRQLDDLMHKIRKACDDNFNSAGTC